MNGLQITASASRSKDSARSGLRWPLWVALLGISFAPSVFGDGYRFFYNLAPGTGFFETNHSRQMSGGNLVSEFRERIQFKVTRTPGASDPSVSARILSLSNKGRPIDYYNGVTFHARFPVTGEISDLAYSGGTARYRALLQAAGIPKGKDIFWMPVFPTAPMNIGDSFSHTVSASGAGGRTEYELEGVEGTLARFRLRYSGSTPVGGGSGTESGEGRAVFDMERGMWRSRSLQVEGNVTLPTGLSMSYKSTRTKEVTSHGGCDRSTTGVDNAEEIIDSVRRSMDDLLRNVTSGWPGAGGDLYAVYRHFHCPTGPQISRIGDHLRRSREILAEPSFVCIPASSDVCRRGIAGDFDRVSESGPDASHWQVVHLCPAFFQLDELDQVGTLIASAVKSAGVSEASLCSFRDACYYNFMIPAEDVITGNPYAYAYLSQELSGDWVPPVQPDRVPCSPSLTDEVIRVRGGDAATDPASVQNEEGDIYAILEDLVTGDHFIRHNRLEGAEHYLYQESHDGMSMRYYLPSGD